MQNAWFSDISYDLHQQNKTKDTSFAARVDVFKGFDYNHEND